MSSTMMLALAVRGQRLDVLAKAEVAAVGGRERQARARRDVVDVLEHRTAFVGRCRRARPGAR